MKSYMLSELLLNQAEELALVSILSEGKFVSLKELSTRPESRVVTIFLSGNELHATKTRMEIPL